MIYLAESGSTKTDAVLLAEDGREIERLEHMGFNPYFHSTAYIASQLAALPLVQKHARAVRQVYFYGAGCSSPALCEVVHEGLQRVFEKARILVGHDLQACAYATYSGEPGIACILGTGSNSAFFDGRELRPSQAGLGFILGDEGSASYIGKKLLTGYFYQTMPREQREEMAREYHLERGEVIKRVYQEPNANLYLAGLAPFAHRHADKPFFWEILFNGFREFLEYHVLCFERAREVPVHFVGSVAYHYRELLLNVLDHLELRPGRIIQRPLDHLIDYHRQYVLPENSQPKSK